jgi:hypothetical protein
VDFTKKDWCLAQLCGLKKERSVRVEAHTARAKEQLWDKLRDKLGMLLSLTDIMQQGIDGCDF